MNQTIRSRIEQIKRGAIPDGYKKTKVGIVPKEWTEHTLSEFFDFKNGLNKEKEAFGKGTPIVNYTDVWGKRGLLKENIKGKVLLSKNEIDLYKVEEGDVFFTRTSETIEEIGLSSVLLEPINDCVFSGFVLRARPKKAGIVKEYNIYCYSSAIMRHEITRKSSMTTRALTNGTLLGEVNINLPNQKEQEKIAEILQEQDRLIELKEKLIEEKKKQKQYLMEALLTGKVRLPGFTDEWITDTLKNHILILNGFAFQSSSYEREGKFKVITIKNVKENSFNTEDCDKISVLPEGIQTHQLLKIGDILMSLTGNVGRVCIVNEEDCLLNQRVAKIVCLNQNETGWIVELLNRKHFVIAMQNCSSGAAQANLSVGSIYDYAFASPKNNDEKIAIADILIEADEEIKLLQKELEEQKRKKQSLMQLLLTGIVRVKA